ncbi:CgeB family protein [Pseudodesulfovibrio sediminis]|uniref:DUF3880 domain-containing protein n=1 Tax=Pseudodesulfovibrio sediminis TaxID=2810563 RepID=A0ABN6EYH0_9BACT|nr:glycosyltransferase [Pseudodesulfovibrio sediminis]BCS90304.1 hypothetical protein PSDVSF_35460 [Pseudodesulfovibrio sediminis]
MVHTPYTAEPILNGPLSDVRIHILGKTWHLWGRKGADREAAMATEIADDTIPVLMGSGLGICLEALLQRGLPVIVVDRETSILDVTTVKTRCTQSPNLLWVDDANPRDALTRIHDFQAANGDLSLAPVIFPLYLRLDRDYYGALNDTIKAAPRPDFWSQTHYPKFQHALPRVLFFDSRYFLCHEILAALDGMGIEHRAISLDNREKGSQEFIEAILKAIIDFKPDFVLTVNHFGLDRQGKLAGLLDDLGLPLASWFVDNPHLILFDYAHPGTDNTTIFTFDAGNIDTIRAKGFSRIHYLPLATDPKSFTPGKVSTQWNCDVSFVGNSMTRPVADSLSQAALPAELARDYAAVARAYGSSGETLVARYLEQHHPDWFAALNALPTMENRLACESLLTWEATRQYRLACVEKTLPFSPTIVGDRGWKHLLPAHGWNAISRLDYYMELPAFYPASKVNFNCTSRQMVGAVNQRVFDVPACGGFLITDYRKEMEHLFDLQTEAVVFEKIDEIPELIDKFLRNKTARQAIAHAARKRILAEHTYELRLRHLLDVMRQS